MSQPIFTFGIGAAPQPEPEVNIQSGSSYALQDSDNGKLIRLTHFSTVSLSVPGSLSVPFSFSVEYNPSVPSGNFTQLHTLYQGAQWIMNLDPDVPITGGVNGTSAPGTGLFIVTGGPNWIPGPYLGTSPFWQEAVPTYDGSHPESDLGTQNLLHLDRFPVLEENWPGADGIGFAVGPGATEQIGFDGNSLTDTGTGMDGNVLNYPNQLLAQAADPKYTYFNAARGGQTTSDMIIRFPYFVAPKLTEGSYTKRYLYVWEFTNAIFFGARASQVLSQQVSGNVEDGDGVEIDGKPYLFKNSVSIEGDVKIGSDFDASLLNLCRAIDHTGTPDTDYHCAAEHPTVKTVGVVVGHQTTVMARAFGAAGNSISLTTSGAGHLSFASSVMVNGLDPDDDVTSGSAARITEMENYCALVRDCNPDVEIGLLTSTPRSLFGVPQEAIRQNTDAWIRNPANIPSKFDRVADVGANPKIGLCVVPGVNGAWLDPDYAQLDGLHINVNGCGYVASVVLADILS